MKAIEEVEHFTYLGSIVDTQGGTEADVKARIGKARVAFLQLKNVWNWKSNVLSLINKIKIFNTNAKTVLRYHADIEDHSDHNKEDTGLFLQLPKKNPWHLVA